MKKTIVGIILAGVTIMAGVISFRLSADALALIVGVLLGIIALVPTLALAMLMLRRNQQQSEDRMSAPTQQPPVIVVSGGYPAMMPMGQGGNHMGFQGMLPPPTQPPREFRVMGHEDTDTVELHDHEWSPRF